MGGNYGDGILYNENQGFWWNSTAHNGASRQYLLYNGSGLSANNVGRRYNGYYIRCINKQKTVLDLTYMQEMTPEIESATTYDLVSHGTDTAGQNECYGNSGYGPGYQYSCIHSSNPTKNNIVDSVWYNYSLASAGTIIDENTTQANPATNTNTATESVCPKNWALPTAKQIDNNRDTANFNLVLGGAYSNGVLVDEDTRGYWSGSDAYIDARRYRLSYNGSSLSTNYGSRHVGMYIRCVSEEKAITSLTYMQDMTPEICFLVFAHSFVI